MSDTHEFDLLGAYALGSLDEDDRERVAFHLANCELCQTELRVYQNVVEQFPYAVKAVDPPADLKQKIMRRATVHAAPAQASERPGWWEQLTSLFKRASPAWGLASLMLILALGVSNLLLLGRLREQPEPLSLDVITLTGTAAHPLAEGLLVLEKGGHDGTLVVNSLEPLDEARQYQLWLIEGEQRTDGGVFSVTAEGYGHLYVELSKPLSAYTGFGITIEPAGGSPGPTGEKVLGVDF